METEERKAYRREWARSKYQSLSEEEKQKKREKQRGYYLQNKEAHQATSTAAAKRRKERDPETFAAKARERSLRHYYKDIDASRALSRAAAKRRREERSEHHKAVKFKYQYGITIEDRDALFERQGRRCAICETTDPGAKAGWNTDHCHSTGAVRFILCAHCNRGLGAFKDNPAVMRKAADMLETFYQARMEEE